MKLLSLILAAVAFTILLITLYPFRQKYSYPRALPTPTPSRFITPTDIPWLTYQNNAYGFSFNYPSGYPDDALQQMTTSYTKSPTKKTVNNIIFYLSRSTTDIGTWTFANFSYKNKNYVMNFGFYPDDKIDKIISSFKFFTPVKYTCPTTEWVDCMPGPGTPKPQCQPDYLNWATVNCPDFKGAAL